MNSGLELANVFGDWVRFDVSFSKHRACQQEGLGLSGVFRGGLLAKNRISRPVGLLSLGGKI